MTPTIKDRRTDSHPTGSARKNEMGLESPPLATLTIAGCAVARGAGSDRSSDGPLDDAGRTPRGSESGDFAALIEGRADDWLFDTGPPRDRPGQRRECVETTGQRHRRRAEPPSRATHTGGLLALRREG